MLPSRITPRIILVTDVSPWRTDERVAVDAALSSRLATRGRAMLVKHQAAMFMTPRTRNNQLVHQRYA